jgi:hypothetical protein
MERVAQNNLANALLAFIIVAIPSGLLAQNLVNIGSYDSLGYPVAVTAQGDYAYVLDNTMGLVVFDVADPANPYTVGQLSLPLWGTDIDLEGDTAYISAGVSEPYSGALYIVDLSDKANPAMLGSFDNQWEFYDVDADNYIYVTDGNGFRAIDVSDPANPTQIIHYTAAGYVSDLRKRGNYLYLTGPAGFQVVVVSDIFNPQILDTCDTPGQPLALALSDYYATEAYIADGDSGVQIISIADPANLFIVGEIQLPDRATEIVMWDSWYLDALAEDSGLVTILVDQPASPVLTGHADTPGRARGIAYDDYIFVVGGQSLDIFELVETSCDYVIGDINGNGSCNGIDVTFGVSYLKGGALPPIACDCPPIPYPFYAAGDINGNCVFNGMDIVFFVLYYRGHYPRLNYCAACPPANPLLRRVAGRSETIR